MLGLNLTRFSIFDEKRDVCVSEVGLLGAPKDSIVHCMLDGTDMVTRSPTDDYDPFRRDKICLRIFNIV